MAILIATLWKAFSAVLAVALLRTFLLWFDGTKYGKRFKDEVIPKMGEHGVANYYAGRFIGLCILVGFALF
jgi:hypothetical protein